MTWLIKSPNWMTTSYYYELMAQAFKNVFGVVNVVDSLIEIKATDKNDVCIVGGLKNAFKLFLKGNKRVILWVQGVKPEESFMMEGKRLKKCLLEIVERYVLKKVIFVIFVSNAMKEHYEKKYNLDFTDRYYVMPCFNEKSIHKDSYYYHNKYNNNVFVYTGSIKSYQCFDETVELYRIIEKKSSKNTELLVFTPHLDKAREIIKRKNIRNYKLKYVEQKDLSKELGRAKFGFAIRHDDVVNRVATPTKFSTYLSNGIMPIFNNYILDFSELTKDFSYVIQLDTINSEDNAIRVLEKMNEKICANDVLSEFSRVFDNYYNTEKHIKNLATKVLRAVGSK